MQKTILTEEEKERAKRLGLNTVLIEKARAVLGEEWYNRMWRQSSSKTMDEVLEALNISWEEYKKLRKERGLY